MRQVKYLAVFLVLLAVLVGCKVGSHPGTGAIEVHVIVTQDFGNQLVLDMTVDMPGPATAKEALEKVARVETSYGGGFITAIEGIKSKFPVREDWFFYLNGLSNNKGIADTTLRDGDILLFDFHDWSFRTFVPAILGSFPEPLVHGCEGKLRPTLIVYEEGFQESAKSLESLLSSSGVGNISVSSMPDAGDEEKGFSNVVVVATPDSSMAAEMNAAWAKLGFFMHFEDGKLVVHDSKGEVAGEYGAGTGVLMASQNPWNPKGIGVCENVVWLVSGVDRDGVEAAVSAILNDHSSFQNAFSFAVSNGELVKVP